MKKFKFSVLLAAMLASSFAFTACGNTPAPIDPIDPEPPAEYTVTFDYRIEGKANETVKVTENEKVTKPEDPALDGFTFGGWFGDADCVYTFDFDKGITADVTAYAKWTDNAKNYYKVTFELNYDGAPAAPSSDIIEGERAIKPAAPVRDGDVEFTGWYVDAAKTEKFDFDTVITEDITVYASWAATTLNVFEAEYTNLTGLKGKGYSNETSGTGLIAADGNGIIGVEGPAKASNGFYISYFYVRNQSLTFKIVSDREVEASTLYMRLSGELIPTITLTDQMWVVKVNDEIMNYGQIVIDNINTDMSIEDKREFQDFLVTAELHLVEGENVITLTVDNGIKMTGAIGCTAPLIDCIKIKTSATLTWSPVTKNLQRFE